MDQRTLVVSCVEYYSDLKAIPSDKVYAAFEKAGFIKMIVESDIQTFSIFALCI